MDYIKRRYVVLAVGVVSLVLVAAIGATVYSAVKAGRITGQQTVVMAPERLSPGAQAALRVIAQDFNTGKPLPDTAVTVQLVPQSGGKSRVVFEGRTDDTGSADVRFTVPEGLEEAQRLVVETASTLGSDSLEQAVTVRREAKLLLTTDKPLYQPGQTIHIRSLALSSADLAPASGQAIEFTIEDPKGNKVFRSELPA